jgi:ketosteroid isomerase-like protein
LHPFASAGADRGELLGEASPERKHEPEQADAFHKGPRSNDLRRGAISEARIGNRPKIEGGAVKSSQASDELGRAVGASDLRAVADRVEIEASRGEFVDALMTGDHDRFASLFTEEGAWRIPYIDVELIGREQIRAGIERMQGLWDYFVQTSHPGTIEFGGDTAAGRAYVSEFGHMREGRSEPNYAVYHDRYERTPDGWKFGERVYEIRYLDTTPRAGSAPRAAPASPGSEGGR